MYKVIGIRPNGNYEIYEVASRKEAKTKKKDMLNTHGFLTVVYRKFVKKK